MPSSEFIFGRFLGTFSKKVSKGDGGKFVRTGGNFATIISKDGDFVKVNMPSKKEKKFESFEEIKKRIPNIPDPEKAIGKRIFQELTNFERYNLLTA